LLKENELLSDGLTERTLPCRRSARHCKEMKSVTHFSHLSSKIVLQVSKALETPANPFVLNSLIRINATFAALSPNAWHAGVSPSGENGNGYDLVPFARRGAFGAREASYGLPQQ